MIMAGLVIPLFLLAEAALVAGVLIVLWRLVTRGTVRPRSADGATAAPPEADTAGRGATWAILVGSAVAALLSLAVTGWLLHQAADSGGHVPDPDTTTWGTLVPAAVLFTTAGLAAQRSGRRRGSVRHASLEATRRPRPTGVTWIRLWLWPPVMIAVDIAFVVAHAVVGEPFRQTADGTIVHTVPEMQGPTSLAMAVAVAVPVIVAAAASAAVWWIVRAPRPQSGWDPRTTLVNWCCGVDAALGAVWLHWLLHGLIWRSPSPGDGPGPAASPAETAVSVIGVLVALGVVAFAAIPRRLVCAPRLDRSPSEAARPAGTPSSPGRQD